MQCGQKLRFPWLCEEKPVAKGRKRRRCGMKVLIPPRWGAGPGGMCGPRQIWIWPFNGFFWESVIHFKERAHFLEHLFSSLFLKFNMGDRLYGPIDMAKKAVKLGKMTMRNKVHNHYHTLPTDSWDLHEFFKGSDNKGILQNSWLSKKPMSILSLFCRYKREYPFHIFQRFSRTSRIPKILQIHLGNSMQSLAICSAVAMAMSIYRRLCVLVFLRAHIFFKSLHIQGCWILLKKAVAKK